MTGHGCRIDGAVGRPADHGEGHQGRHGQCRHALGRADGGVLGEREDRVEAPVGEDREQDRAEPVQRRSGHRREVHHAPRHERDAHDHRADPGDHRQVLQHRHDSQLVQVDDGGDGSQRRRQERLHRCRGGPGQKVGGHIGHSRGGDDARGRQAEPGEPTGAGQAPSHPGVDAALVRVPPIVGAHALGHEGRRYRRHDVDDGGARADQCGDERRGDHDRVPWRGRGQGQGGALGDAQERLRPRRPG